MARVAIIAAEPFELKYIRPKPGWRLLAGGPGPHLAAGQVPADVDVVVSTGLCGGLNPSLKVGDIVVATSVNGIAVAELEGPGVRARGPIASLDRVIGTVEGKQELYRTGAVAVEMEAAGVLVEARRLQLPFFCVKAVSDAAHEGFWLDLNAARDKTGRFRVPSILWQAAQRPWKGLPELVRLKRHSERASKALGEFFEHCGF